MRYIHKLPWNRVGNGYDLKEAYLVDIPSVQKRSQNDGQGYGQGDGVNKVTRGRKHMSAPTNGMVPRYGFEEGHVHNRIVVHQDGLPAASGKFYHP